MDSGSLSQSWQQIEEEWLPAPACMIFQRLWEVMKGDAT
jgi:hypothetical protein